MVFDKGWKGSVVVVSHNKEFVTRLATTHTAIVKNGALQHFDRPPRADDWAQDGETTAWRSVGGLKRNATLGLLASVEAWETGRGRGKRSHLQFSHL